MLTLLLLIIIYLCFISLGLPDALLGSAWPLMHDTLNVPLAYAGILSMIVSSGNVIAVVSSARIIKRFGTRFVVITAISMTATALIGISFSSSFLYLCLCAIPLGLGSGTVDASLNNYIAVHFKARHMNWLHCFWGVGASIGPIIMSFFLINYNVWNLGYRAIGIIQLSLVILLFISLPLWKRNDSTEKSAKHEPIRYKEIFSIAGIKEALLAFFCYCSIEMITGLWAASFLVVEKGILPEIAAQWIALYFIGITVGRFVSGFVTFKLNNRQMVRIGHIIIACGIITLFLPFGEHTLLPGLFLIGLGCAPIFPCLMHETPRNFGTEHSQAIIGLQMGSAYIGVAVMPPLFGWLASYTGFGIFPVVIGIILIIKIFVVESLNRKINREKLK